MSKIKQFIHVVADSFNALAIYKLMGDELEQDFLKKNAAITQTPTGLLLNGDALPILESSKNPLTPRKINWGIVNVSGGVITHIGGVPIGSSGTIQNLWETIVSDSGSTTASTPTDTLNIIGAGTITTSIVGDILTITGVGGAGQNVFATIYGDTGSRTASSLLDYIKIKGSGVISTSLVGDTLTINGNGQNIWKTITADSGTTSASSPTTVLQVTGSNGITTSMVGNNLIIQSTGTSVNTIYTAMSVTGNGAVDTPVKLLNDTLAPPSSSYYGTNTTGTKGWHLLPTTGYVTYIVYNEAELLTAWASARLDTTKAAAIYIGGTITLTANRSFIINVGQAAIKFIGVTGSELINVGSYTFTVARLSIEGLAFNTTSQVYIYADQCYLTLTNVIFVNDVLYDSNIVNMKTHVRCIGSITNGTGAITIRGVRHYTQNVSWNTSGDIQPIIVSNQAGTFPAPDSRLYVIIENVEALTGFDRFSRVLLHTIYNTQFFVTGDLTWWYHPSQVFPGGTNIPATAQMLKRGSVDDLRGDYIPDGTIVSLLGLDSNNKVRKAPSIALGSEMSIVGDGTAGNKFKLSGDETNPGSDKYYGTNAVGVKGYHAFSFEAVTTWLALSDTIPETFLGRARQVPMVVDEENALDLVETEELQTVLATFLLLDDVPLTYTGSEEYYVKVRADGTGLYFSPT